MPYVQVHVCEDDIISDMEDHELEEELARRRKKRGEAHVGGSHPWTPLGMAEDFRTAFYAHNASRFETLLATLDPASRTPGLTSAPIAALPLWPIRA